MPISSSVDSNVVSISVATTSVGSEVVESTFTIVGSILGIYVGTMVGKSVCSIVVESIVVESISVESIQVESIVVEPIAVESIIVETIAVESIVVDSVVLDSSTVDSIVVNSVVLDSSAVVGSEVGSGVGAGVCCVLASGVGDGVGCVSIEGHEDETCTNASLVAPNNRSIGVSYKMNDECNYHPVCTKPMSLCQQSIVLCAKYRYSYSKQIWQTWMKHNCIEGTYSSGCNSTCGNCTEVQEIDPDDPDILDVWIGTAAESVCLDLSDGNESSSINMWGYCSLEPSLCPSGEACGPENCSPADNDYCVEIEIFDQNSTCNAVSGAGDYSAYVIADGVCRMDGSGRSYYALQCAEGRGWGVIGCEDCLCSVGCQEVGGEEGLPPNECYQEDWLDNLQIALIGNETNARCNEPLREIVIQDSCELTHSPTTAQPTTSEPTTQQTPAPSPEPTPPTPEPTTQQTPAPTPEPSTQQTPAPTPEPTPEPTSEPTPEPTSEQTTGVTTPESTALESTTTELKTIESKSNVSTTKD